MGLDAFGPGLRLVLRLALVLLGAWLTHAAVVLVSVVADAWRSHVESLDELDALTDAEIGEAAPWAQPDARPLDDVRSALDLFERRYGEAQQRPVLRFGPDGGPEFIGSMADAEQFDLDRWLRERRRHGDAPL